VTVPEVAAPTFASLAREHPEWRGWLGVMRAALDEAGDPAWRHVVVVPSSAREPGYREVAVRPRRAPGADQDGQRGLGTAK